MKCILLAVSPLAFLLYSLVFGIEFLLTVENKSMKTSYRNFKQQLIGVFLEITLEKRV